MLNRQRGLTAVAVVVAVLLAAMVGVKLLRHTSDPDPAATVSRSQPVPATPSTVVLMPGFGGSPSSLELLAGQLRAAGHPVAVVTLPGDATGDITEMATALGRAVDSVRPSASAVDVVGYSMGGLVARVWAADQGGAAEARRIVTVGTPNQGTDLAGLAAFAGACPTACQQMEPGSDFLDALGRGDPTPDGPAWITVWSADDDTIRPPDSTSLDGATNVRLQDACPAVVVDHAGLVHEAEPLAVVVSAVGSEPWSRPTGCLSH